MAELHSPSAAPCVRWRCLELGRWIRARFSLDPREIKVENVLDLRGRSVGFMCPRCWKYVGSGRLFVVKRAIYPLDELVILMAEKQSGKEAMKRSRTTIFSVLCGLACAVCVFAYTQGVRGEVDAARAEALARYGGEQLEVCVAKRDIAAGETVDAGSVEVRLWVADLLPSEAVREAGQVVGKKASSAILAGEVLSERRFRESGSQLDVPNGLTAVSVPAKDVQAVGGAVAAGAHADIYATGGTSTDLIVSDVLVLATNASSGDEASGANVAWITVAVEPESVQEIVSAAQKTELYFTLPGTSVQAEAGSGGAGGDGEGGGR